MPYIPQLGFFADVVRCPLVHSLRPPSCSIYNAVRCLIVLNALRKLHTLLSLHRTGIAYF